MKVYIGFSKPTTALPLFGWLIQLVIHRPYDHAYVRIQEPMFNQWMIFEASKQMVNMYSIPWFTASNKVVKEYELDVTPAQYQELWQFMMNNLGVPYSLKEVIGIGLNQLFGIKSPFDPGLDGEVCSVLAARVAVMLGITIPEEITEVAPDDLDNILHAAGVPRSA